MYVRMSVRSYVCLLPTTYLTLYNECWQWRQHEKWQNLAGVSAWSYRGAPPLYVTHQRSCFHRSATQNQRSSYSWRSLQCWCSFVDTRLPSAHTHQCLQGVCGTTHPEIHRSAWWQLTVYMSGKILGMLKFWSRNSSLDDRACPSWASSGIQYCMPEEACDGRRCINVFEWLLVCSIIQRRISTSTVYIHIRIIMQLKMHAHRGWTYLCSSLHWHPVRTHWNSHTQRSQVCLCRSVHNCLCHLSTHQCLQEERK